MKRIVAKGFLPLFFLAAINRCIVGIIRVLIANFQQF